VRVVPPYRELGRALPRRLRWTRARVPTRRRIPRLHRPEGRAIVRPSARVSLLQLAATLGVAFVIWSAGTVFQAVYAGRIYPHIIVDHVPVGGMTRDEALAALRDTEKARVDAPIFVQADEKSWRVTPAQFGARYDSAAAVGRALALAHAGSLFFGGWNEAQTIFNGANVPLSGTHDPPAVSRFVAAAARELSVSPRGAEVGVRGGDVTILRAPVPGRQLDRPGAVAALSAVINTHDATTVDLPLQQVDSGLGRDEARTAVDRADALLSGRVQFLYTDTANGSAPPWYLDKEGMLRLLTFTPRCEPQACRFDVGIDERKLLAAFDRGGVSAKVDSVPRSASYVLYKPDLNPADVSVQPTQDFSGTTIDVHSAALQILRQADVPASQRVANPIYLPMQSVPPRFTKRDAVALNFDLNVGATTLGYAGLGSDWARLDNLGTAANAITNTIVPPGGLFSFASVAGPLDATQGYTAGQNIVGPGDITGVDGGVNLAASAALGAAYDAGLQVERRAHYPYLSLYTQPGLDAMVSYDARDQGQGRGQGRAPDLVLRNTTGHAVLVMAEGDGVGGVTVYFFNSDNYAPMRQRGRYSVVVGAPRVSLNPDGSVDATISRTITINGKVTTTTRDSLSSHYQPIDP
jgi:hypothetical protein